MTFIRFYVALFFLLNIAIASVGTAQPMDIFSFQGRLTDANGSAVVDGSYAVDFGLHTQARGGTQVWTESQTVTTQEGIFTVQLGSSQPFGSLAFDTPYYLSLTVAGQTMTPRTLLSATPYAMRAHRLAASALRAGSNVTISENGRESFKH